MPPWSSGILLAVAQKLARQHHKEGGTCRGSVGRQRVHHGVQQELEMTGYSTSNQETETDGRDPSPFPFFFLCWS